MPVSLQGTVICLGTMTTLLQRKYVVTIIVTSGNGVLAVSQEKHFGDHNGRMRKDVLKLEQTQMYCPRSSSAPPWKKSSLVFIKPKRKAKVQEFCAIGLVHVKA